MTPTIFGLVQRIEDDALDLVQLLAWLQWSQTAEIPPTFMRDDACGCPVAVFLRERYNADELYEHEGAHEPLSIEVGDDDITVEGFYARTIPPDLRRFVRWFDDEFKGRHHHDRISIEETFKAYYSRGYRS